VAEWQTRYVQGVVSARAWEFKSPLRHQGENAPVAQLGLERSPAEADVAGSSPTRRAIFSGYIWAVSSVGQSTCFTRRGSVVQILYRPPSNTKGAPASLKMSVERLLTRYALTARAEGLSPKTVEHRFEDYSHTLSPEAGIKYTSCRSG
jgi:hypothetical protein